MDILQIVTVALTGMILAAIIRSYKAEYAIFVVLATAIILFFMALGKLTSVFQFLKTIYGDMSYGKEFFPIIIKVLVVAYLTDFTAQVCKDAGEGAIAEKVELAGKVIIFYLAIPILLSIIDLLNSVL